MKDRTTEWVQLGFAALFMVGGLASLSASWPLAWRHLAATRASGDMLNYAGTWAVGLILLIGGNVGLWAGGWLLGDILKDRRARRIRRL